jgi:hypothetical protein
VLDHMAAEDSSESLGGLAEVSLSVLAVDIKSLLAAYRKSLFRMIDPNGFDAGVGKKFEEHTTAAADV